jgi:serine-type D-Ala-D-Ala endopeptidase (penicillin-binding protein 7)
MTQTMAPPWKKALTALVAPTALALCVVLPFSAYAAKAADPCKTSAKSASCKAQKAKKKSAASKDPTVTVTKTKAKKSAAAKTPPAKATAGKAKPSKAVPAKTASAKTVVATRSANTATLTPRIQTRLSGGKPSKVASKKKGDKASKARAQASAATLAVAAIPAPASSLREEIAALRSSTAYVQDLGSSTVLFAKNEDVVRPIASISKLMTAVIVVDANLPMNEMLEVTGDDVDSIKRTTSRLKVGTRLSRGDMLHLALMSSENRAAHALGRHYPGGLGAFVAAMNAKAQSLGMTNTRFVEPTGLSSDNVSSPHDLARLLRAASLRPLIHRYSTDSEYDVEIDNRTQTFRNTNLLVRKADWDIKISKTGFINEAGECLVMLARINGRDLAIVLLDSQGKLSRIGDAVRLRRIVQSDVAML